MKFTLLVVSMTIVGSLAAQESSQSAGLQRHSITEKDLFNFVWVANPEVSPDGTHVAFTRVTVDEKRSGYESSIWMVATKGVEAPVRMTNGKHDAQPRWSPDGKHLVFVRGGDKDETGKPKPGQLAMLSLEGGEAWTITDLPKGAATPVWSPDGKQIAFLSSTTQEDILKAQRKKNAIKAGDAKPSDSDHESDVHVISRAVYRSNDQGYLDLKRHEHIWVLQVPASDELPHPVQLTSGNFDETQPVWSRDGLRIYFLTERVDEPYYELPRTDIYSVSAAAGNPEKLATIPMDIDDLVLSPDGRKLAFHGRVTQPIRSYSQPDLWVMDVATDPVPKNLTANYDFDMGGGAVLGDNTAPRGGRGRRLFFSPDGGSLFDIVGKQGRSPIVRVDVRTGSLTDITRGDQTVLDFSVNSDSGTMVALVSTPVSIGDLFSVAGDGRQTRITDFNHKLWSQLNLTAPEEINYASFDGRQIQGWVQKPPDFDSHNKYPLILNIHGGPHAAYGWVFDHEFQWMAAKGYVVLYVNPRGSTGYGQEFGNIIQYHYPGDDYRDLMLGVDELLKRGYIDGKKLGVTGGSGGGVLTDWTITHTDRFAAAVSQRDISNWASWWYTADFTLFQPNWFKAPPFEDPQAYSNLSAITFVKNIHTPALFVLGESDYRTPEDSGGEQLFRALKYMKRPTAMVVFPRESHELSRSGEPWHRIERLEYIVGWFDKWMMGTPHPEFDINPGQMAATSDPQQAAEKNK